MILILYRVLMGSLYVVARLGNLLIRRPSRERLGFYDRGELTKVSSGHVVWLHAASAGEVNAIAPFCGALRRAKPGIRIVVTTTSLSGRRIAREKGIADAAFLAPLDTGAALGRAFSAIRPVMVLVAETEFWPNFLQRAGRNGLPVLLLNGRISDKSFPRYRRWRSLFLGGLDCFGACLVQTGKDAQRLAGLGVSEKRIQVVGQMKYDGSPSPAEAIEAFGRELGLGSAQVLFTLGSLREGEEDILLPIVPAILALSKEIRLVIAPRHPKNAERYREILERSGVPTALRSALGRGSEAPRVILLDTVGELALAYALSRAAFVGGTLAPIGGHNVMEPALASIPVCFGPDTRNVEEAAGALEASGGGVRVRDGEGLLEAFKAFLDEGKAKEAGRKAFASVGALRGATDRTVAEVVRHWPL